MDNLEICSQLFFLTVHLDKLNFSYVKTMILNKF